MRIALLWAISQPVMEILYQRFGTTLSPIFKGQDKMGARGCPETPVVTCHSALCNNPEERNSEHHLQGRK